MASLSLQLVHEDAQMTQGPGLSLCLDSPPVKSPDTPLDGTPKMDTPMVVRQNQGRRVVGVGKAGSTPKVVREVELTPNAVRRARDFCPPSLTFDSGFDPIEVPSKFAGGNSDGNGGKKKKNRRKKKNK